MNKHHLVLPLLLPLLLLQGCGGGGGSDSATASEAGSEGFYAPSYGDATSDTRYEADLEAITSTVVDNQDDGAEIVALIPDSNGLVRILADQKVRLIAMSRHDCPSGLDGCDTTDSAKLRVGSNALVEEVRTLTETIKDQGERGTCVAFALNAGAEVLLRRQSQSTPLAEQNTYFEGKHVTNTWDDEGLSPYDTISEFIQGDVKLVSEAAWPYNPNDKDCSEYWNEHPNSTCSATEAQGGGSDHRQQDPSAKSADGYALSTAHQLYASVGRIKQALYRGYPVVMAVNANYDFLLATQKGGVVSWTFKADDCGASLCGHAILAVGYQDDTRVDGGGYFIVRNSWGDNWGDGGLAYVTYEWLQHSLLDAQALVEYRAR